MAGRVSQAITSRRCVKCVIYTSMFQCVCTQHVAYAAWYVAEYEVQHLCVLHWKQSWHTCTWESGSNHQEPATSAILSMKGHSSFHKQTSCLLLGRRPCLQSRIQQGAPKRMWVCVCVFVSVAALPQFWPPKLIMPGHRHWPSRIE